MGIYLIVLYVLAMLVLGYWAMRKTKNVNDFWNEKTRLHTCFYPKFC